MGVRPKKHLGQHFLTDHNIARKIVDQLSCSYPVLEIGPGKGILTQYLLGKANRGFYLIEIDTEASAYLENEYPQLKGSLITGDFLKTDLTRIFLDDFSVIGNFPYNISSQIFFRILDQKDRVKEIVCMLQKEVAQRISSSPGSKEYGILSVLLQTFYSIEYSFTVGEGVFFPPPKVKSAVIRLERNERKSLPCPDRFYITVIKTAFNQRRKTLRNALQQLLPQPNDISADILRRRAETLSVEEFITLSANLYKG